MAKVHARQSFLGPRSESILHALRVGVIGVGGGGSHIVQQLAHAGVGNFVLADPDVFESHNLNRTVGARLSDVSKRRSKVDIAKRLIRGVNPAACVRPMKKKWADVRLLLAACDALVGGVDTYLQRSEIEAFARRYLIPYVDIGMDVDGASGAYTISGQVIASIPGQPCFRCLGFITVEKLSLEAAHYGNVGGRPQVVWSNGLLASAAVSTLIKWFCPWNADRPAATYLDYDGNRDRLTEHNRLLYLREISCQHFATRDSLGDPFWTSS